MQPTLILLLLPMVSSIFQRRMKICPDEKRNASTCYDAVLNLTQELVDSLKHGDRASERASERVYIERMNKLTECHKLLLVYKACCEVAEDCSAWSCEGQRISEELLILADEYYYLTLTDASANSSLAD